LAHDTGYEKAAHLYDLFDTKDNIPFFLHYAMEAGAVLDIGAGTGRIAIPLAERGVGIFCVEPSLAMRSEFLRKLGTRSDLAANITLVAADARSFALSRPFPAAFLSGTFDHFLDGQERLSSLLNIARHLQPNGKLVFDVFLGLMKDTPLSPAGRVEQGDREYRRFVGGSLLPNRTRETILVFETYEAGALVERVEERSLVGVVERQDVHHLLREAGFAVTREFSNYDFTAFQEGDSLLIIEAIKGE
jgi:SAM-dependent methyltransferase